MLIHNLTVDLTSECRLGHSIRIELTRVTVCSVEGKRCCFDTSNWCVLVWVTHVKHSEVHHLQMPGPDFSLVEGVGVASQPSSSGRTKRTNNKAKTPADTNKTHWPRGFLCCVTKVFLMGTRHYFRLAWCCSIKSRLHGGTFCDLGQMTWMSFWGMRKRRYRPVSPHFARHTTWCWSDTFRILRINLESWNTPYLFAEHDTISAGNLEGSNVILELSRSDAYLARG